MTKLSQQARKVKDLEDRLQTARADLDKLIASELEANHRHGRVSELAKATGLARETIYAAQRRVAAQDKE